MTRVEFGRLIVTGADEVAGVTWYKLGFERLRDEGLDGGDEATGLLEVRVLSVGLLMVTGWSDVVALLVVNWPFQFHTQGCVLVETVGLGGMGGMFVGV